MIPFIDLKAQQNQVRLQIDAAIHNVLDHGQYIMGPEVQTFETNLQCFTGTKNALSCANGTDALVIALMALNIGPGDAVFAPSFTFVATVEAVKLVGAEPVFVDVKEETFNICPVSLSEAVDEIKTRTELTPKAIIPVDLFGQPAEYDQIQKIAKTYNLKIIADAAQSFGSQYDNQHISHHADITTTSFFPAKPLGCYGDGGAIFTNNNDLANIIKSYRNHGQGTDRYDNINIGLNSRLDSIQAAILIEKLKIFPSEITARNAIAQQYHAGLSDNFLKQQLHPKAQSVWAQYTIAHENRDSIRQKLQEAHIPTAVYYPKPNHLQAPYIHSHSAPKGLPNTEHLQERVFSLPMHPYIETETQKFIIETTNKAIQ